jgi:predicted Rossmann-fold nucleotide-binding protein
MRAIIAVIGGSTCSPAEMDLAEQTGRLLAQRGAVIAIGGGWGTLSEIALAQRIGTPVAGLHDAFPRELQLPRLGTPEAAVTWALQALTAAS